MNDWILDDTVDAWLRNSTSLCSNYGREKCWKLTEISTQLQLKTNKCYTHAVPIQLFEAIQMSWSNNFMTLRSCLVKQCGGMRRADDHGRIRWHSVVVFKPWPDLKVTDFAVYQVADRFPSLGIQGNPHSRLLERLIFTNLKQKRDLNYKIVLHPTIGSVGQTFGYLVVTSSGNPLPPTPPWQRKTSQAFEALLQKKRQGLGLKHPLFACERDQEK